MNKKILIGSIIAVAIIVLSSFSSVVAKVSVDNDELVELDVEFCGLNKKHTVKLTQQEADEVELLFDDIEQRLSEVETREEAEVTMIEKYLFPYIFIQLFAYFTPVINRCFYNFLYLFSSKTTV